MNREKCINRNITIASAIISGVNILTFYNAFYKCFKFKSQIPRSVISRLTPAPSFPWTGRCIFDLQKPL